MFSEEDMNVQDYRRMMEKESPEHYPQAHRMEWTKEVEVGWTSEDTML